MSQGDEDWWEEQCQKWRRRSLTGKFSHYCNDWDGLPVDETCEEINSCYCDFGELGKPPKAIDE